MLSLYLFLKELDGILFWGGSTVAFMIGGWAGVAWWAFILIAILLWMIAWTFFRAFFCPTREMKETMPRASDEEERKGLERGR